MDEAIDQEYKALDKFWLFCPDKASTCNTASDMEMLGGYCIASIEYDRKTLSQAYNFCLFRLASIFLFKVPK